MPKLWRSGREKTADIDMGLLEHSTTNSRSSDPANATTFREGAHSRGALPRLDDTRKIEPSGDSCKNFGHRHMISGIGTYARV